MQLYLLLQCFLYFCQNVKLIQCSHCKKETYNLCNIINFYQQLPFEICLKALRQRRSVSLKMRCAARFKISIISAGVSAALRIFQSTPKIKCTFFIYAVSWKFDTKCFNLSVWVFYKMKMFNVKGVKGVFGGDWNVKKSRVTLTIHKQYTWGRYCVWLIYFSRQLLQEEEEKRKTSGLN